MTTARHLTRSYLAVAALVGGCDATAPILCDGGSCGTQSSWRRTFQHTVNRKVDVLFVVDDTAAVAPYAGALAPGFADMARALQTLPLAGPASLHVGFVRAGSCDTSTRGAACGLGAPEQYLRSEWCEMVTNLSSPFEQTFSCLADLGAASCAPAQPLSVARQLLTGPPRAGWDGFLRPDAYLMIVIVAGQDDASGQTGSLTPVAQIAASIRGLKQDPSQILVSGIVPASCAAEDPPAPRLTEFVQGFGANGVLVDLCDGQLAPALLRLGDHLWETVEPACAQNVRDTDLDTPGLQADCTFEQHVFASDGSFTSSAVPSCDVGSLPCWRLVHHEYCGPGYAVVIEHAPDWCDEAGENFAIECLACANRNDPACAPQP